MKPDKSRSPHSECWNSVSEFGQFDTHTVRFPDARRSVRSIRMRKQLN